MNIRQQLLLIVLISAGLFHVHPISAQNVMENLYRAPSPQAADLGRFGDIPMSYYTGRANITIPIRSFSERGVTLDINLTYDTSGLLMNKLPGWVGPGWTLNAGGCITRIQNNFCDEMGFNNHYPEFNNYQNYFHSFGGLTNGNGQPDLETIYGDNGYGQHDYSPDIFYFNFMGKTGQFFLGNDGQWKVSSDDNIVVEFDYEQTSNYITPVFSTFPADPSCKQPKAIKGFKLYDDEGTRYTFGCDTAAIEYSTDLFRTTRNEDFVPWVATSWFLTKVEDRLGNKLFNLEYDRGKFMVQLFKTVYSQQINHTTAIPGSWFNGVHDEYVFQSGFSGTLNLPVYLKSITTFGGDSVTFSMRDAFQPGSVARHLYPSLYVNGQTSASSLVKPSYYYDYPFYYLQINSIDSIRYRRAYNQNLYDDPLAAIDMQILDSITVHHNMSANSVLQSYVMEYDSIGRLHLSGLRVKDESKQLMKYTFSYNNYQSVPQDYLTDQHDHWGYLNQYNREPSLEYATRGMLTEIAYPTGGTTQLEYELHNYTCVLSANRQSMINESGTAGGLRIRAIKDYGTGYQITRRFDYNDTYGNSTGQLFAKPTYSWFWIQTNFKIYFSQDAPIIPLCTSKGTHIGYTTVTEILGDSTKHRRTYSNYSDVKDEMPLATSLIGQASGSTPYDRFSELGFMRGKLLYECINDSNGVPHKEIAYTYRQDSTEYKSEYSYSSNVTIIPSPSGQLYIYGVGCVYKLYYPKYDLVKTVTSTRYGNSMVTDTTTYTRQTFQDAVGGWTVFPFFRKCMAERTSRGNQSYSKSYSYSTNSTMPCFMPLTQCTAIENGVVTETTSTVYGFVNSHYMPMCELIDKGGGADTIVTYHSYTPSGLLLSYSRPGEYPTRLYWNSQGRLMASVTCPPDLASQITPYSSPTDPKLVLRINGQSIFNYPEVNATTYIYDDRGNIAASATANGFTQYYLYDDFGRLTEIQDADHHTIQRYKYNYKTSGINLPDPITI